MGKNNPFNGMRYDLGTSSTTQVSKDDIDLSFSSPYTEPRPCIFCTNASSFRIIPKEPEHCTAEIEDKGFICEHCLSQGYLSKKIYGVREISK